MNAYKVKTESAGKNAFAADDLLLTKDMPTTAGSKMLANYVSLLESEAISRAKDAGYALCGKVSVGEFGIDTLGETDFEGALSSDGTLKYPAAIPVQTKDALFSLTLDVNGAPRRGAAQENLVALKPTYGTVSRYGTVPVACSGETVSILAETADVCRTVLDAVSGHDDKDGTSLSDEKCALLKKDAARKPVRRIALLADFCEGVSDEVKAHIAEAKETLAAAGAEITEVENSVILRARAAWNVLMCAELCNNVSRYDGVKYGYRAPHFSGLDELYVKSRTEAFGDLLKTAILFGSETLSTENYMKVYDKCLRVRRVIAEAFDALFSEFDAVLLPAVSTLSYREEDLKQDKFFSFTENLYTAPASITGLPAVVAGGVQLIGAAFSENALLDAAKLLTKEG